jgi:hypothetical protein
MPEYRSFSATAMSLYLLRERDAVSVSPSIPEVTASVWVDSKHLLAAIHNPGPGNTTVEVSILKQVLATYNAPTEGQMKFTVLNGSGTRVPNTLFHLDTSDPVHLKIRGELSENKTVLCMLER